MTPAKPPAVGIRLMTHSTNHIVALTICMIKYVVDRSLCFANRMISTTLQSVQPAMKKARNNPNLNKVRQYEACCVLDGQEKGSVHPDRLISMESDTGVDEEET